MMKSLLKEGLLKQNIAFVEKTKISRQLEG